MWCVLYFFVVLWPWLALFLIFSDGKSREVSQCVSPTCASARTSRRASPNTSWPAAPGLPRLSNSETATALPATTRQQTAPPPLRPEHCNVPEVARKPESRGTIVSPAMTTKRALPCDPLNSGYLASLRLLANCQLQGNPVHLVGLLQRCPVPMMGGHQSCIQCQLHTSEGGQSLGHDLQPPRISTAARDVEVSDHDVPGNSGSCFPADPFHSAFDSETSPAGNPFPACCTLPGGGQTSQDDGYTHRNAQTRAMASSDASEGALRALIPFLSLNMLGMT